MKIRRLVAGVDENGRSVVLSDGPAPFSRDYAFFPGQAHTRVWRVGSAVSTEPPADEPTTDTGPALPEPGGSSFLVLQVAPDSAMSDPRFDPAKAGEEIGESLPDIAAAMEPDNPGMHQTRTLDYGIVLDGEVTLELDDGVEVALTAGDTVVQLGSRHAWRNHSDRPATVAFVLTGATH